MITSTTTNTRRILRIWDVQQLTGFSRSGIYKLVSEGRFPRPKKLSIRASGWDSNEVEQWLNSRLDAEV